MLILNYLAIAMRKSIQGNTLNEVLDSSVGQTSVGQRVPAACGPACAASLLDPCQMQLLPVVLGSARGGWGMLEVGDLADSVPA